MQLSYHTKVKDIFRLMLSGWWFYAMLGALASYPLIKDGVLLAMVSLLIFLCIFLTLTLGVLWFWCKPATIKIDEHGITDTTNGKTRHWTWQKVGKIALDERYLCLWVAGWLILIPVQQVGKNSAAEFYRLANEYKKQAV